MPLSPAFPEAYYHHAQLLHHQGDDEKALQTLNEGLKQKFNHLSTVCRETYDSFREEFSPAEPS